MAWNYTLIVEQTQNGIELQAGGKKLIICDKNGAERFNNLFRYTEEKFRCKIESANITTLRELNLKTSICNSKETYNSVW